MATPNRVNYYTYIKIPGQKISQSGMDALVRMCNERFQDLSTRVYGNLQTEDLSKDTKKTLSESATDVTSEDVKINAADGLRIDTVLSSGATTAAVYFQAKGTQIGLYRTSDNKQLWGGKLLASGQVVTVTSALIDPDGDGSSVFLVQTSDGKTLLTLDMDSYQGATDEENPTPAGRLPGLRMGAANGYTWQISDYADDWYSYLIGQGLLEIRGTGDVVISARADGEEFSRGSLVLGSQYSYDSNGAIGTGGHFVPIVSGTDNMGTTGNRYRRLYCTLSVDVSSDERLKQDIKDLDPSLIMKLRPRAYRLKANPGKLQYGLIAQEVKAALDECGIVDADLYGDENPDSLSLRYEQFIAPLIATVQAQEKRIKALEEKLGGTA